MKSNLWYSVKIVAACMVLLIAIGFVEKKHYTKVVNQAEVRINHQNGNFFVSEEDVLDLIEYDATIGDRLTAETMTEMENRLLDHDFINEAEVYRDLSGKLLVEISQCEPIARISRPDDADAYISSIGKILPVSSRFSARVLLITGDYTDKLVATGSGQDQETAEMMALIKYIYQDRFWRAQIAQLDIGSEGDIVMYPQVGKQLIEFGTPHQYQSKFTRLDTFYKQILPKEGWNEYQRVSVKYTDQIICE